MPNPLDTQTGIIIDNPSSAYGLETSLSPTYDADTHAETGGGGGGGGGSTALWVDASNVTYNFIPAAGGLANRIALQAAATAAIAEGLDLYIPPGSYTVEVDVVNDAINLPTALRVFSLGSDVCDITFTPATIGAFYAFGFDLTATSGIYRFEGMTLHGPTAQTFGPTNGSMGIRWFGSTSIGSLLYTRDLVIDGQGWNTGIGTSGKNDMLLVDSDISAGDVPVSQFESTNTVNVRCILRNTYLHDALEPDSVGLYIHPHVILDTDSACRFERFERYGVYMNGSPTMANPHIYIRGTFKDCAVAQTSSSGTAHIDVDAEGESIDQSNVLLVRQEAVIRGRFKNVSSMTSLGGASAQVIKIDGAVWEGQQVSAILAQGNSNKWIVRDADFDLIGQNEIQTITVDPTYGAYTITFNGQTTASIAVNATAATIQTELEALSNIGVGDVAVTGADGGPYTVEFTGTLATTNVVQMTSTHPMRQTVTISATGGTWTLTYSGQTTAAMDWNASAAAVQTALEDLSNLVPGDVTVTGAAGGPYTIKFPGGTTGLTGSAPLTTLTGLYRNVTIVTIIGIVTTQSGRNPQAISKSGTGEIDIDGITLRGVAGTGASIGSSIAVSAGLARIKNVTNYLSGTGKVFSFTGGTKIDLTGFRNRGTNTGGALDATSGVAANVLGGSDNDFQGNGINGGVTTVNQTSLIRRSGVAPTSIASAATIASSSTSGERNTYDTWLITGSTTINTISEPDTFQGVIRLVAAAGSAWQLSAAGNIIAAAGVRAVNSVTSLLWEPTAAKWLEI